MKSKILLSAILVIALMACRNRFITPSYEEHKRDHKTIAVIPMKSTYTGKIPEEVTEEDIIMIEDAESVRFQELVMNYLVYESGVRRNDIGIGLLSTQVTNSRLEAKGISIRDAIAMDPTALADSLGVDAIVKGYVLKNRFMSDLESLKIEGAEIVLRTIANSAGVGLPIPGGMVNNLKRTYYIESGLELLDGEDGSILWKITSSRNADWQYQPEQAIANMAFQFADNFPYRNKEFKR
ncbi:hypothetical protein GYB22_01775 [bacterium]|nr:hypothetical protein [bacterium]